MILTGKYGNRLWLVGFTSTLTMGMAAATFTQFAMGSLGPRLVDELTLSRAQFGALTTGFFVVGAITSPVVGPLTDRLGGRRALVALFVLDGLAFLGMSISPSYAWLLLAVAAAGTALALCNPSTNLLIAQHIPHGKRGAIIGVKQSGVYAGSVLAGLLLPGVAATAGWRTALAFVAAAPVVGIAASFWLVPPDQSPARAEKSQRQPIGALRWLAPYALLMGAGVAAISAYVPLYGHETVGMSERTAGLSIAVIGAVAVPARIMWSRYSEQLRTTAAPLLVIAGLSILTGLLLLAAESFGAAAFWIGVVFAGTSASAWNSVGMLAVVREAGAGAAGRASGVVLTAFYLGLLAMPVLFGALVDSTGTYRFGWLLATFCFLLAAMVAAGWLRRAGRWSVDPVGL